MKIRARFIQQYNEWSDNPNRANLYVITFDALGIKENETDKKEESKNLIFEIVELIREMETSKDDK